MKAGTGRTLRLAGHPRLALAVLAVGAAVATATPAGADPVAGSAGITAPSGFDVKLYHSSSTLVGRLQGNLAWSTSGRTVNVTGQDLYVRDGECVDLAYAGYQGNTRVTPLYGLANQCQSMKVGDFPIATDTPGGITQVNITLTDVQHGNKAGQACRKDASSCTNE